MNFDNIKIISAGAGSGKTYQLGEELNQLLDYYDISQIMATSFTKKAASELQERMTKKLTEKGKIELSARIEEAFIGTVNSVCGKLLENFAIDAGLKPELKVLDEKQAKDIFKLAISSLWSDGKLEEIASISSRFAIDDIQDQVMQVGNLMLSNNMDKRTIDQSKEFSKTSYLECLGQPKTNSSWLNDARDLAIAALENLIKEKNTVGATIAYQNKLQEFITEVQTDNHSWKTIGWLHSYSPAAALRTTVEDLKNHLSEDHKMIEFQRDIENLIEGVFNVAMEAIEKYNSFKKEHGLIDFTDQEVLLNKLLENDEVLDIISKEIKVLMVDEFQDTSPIQLKIFLAIAAVVEQVVFVGDVKQCIYEFRDSDTYLINKLIKRCGGIQTENILDTSYRSREPLVSWVNGLFQHTFRDIPPEHVVLKANRKEKSVETPAIHLWKFQVEIEKKGKVEKKAPVKDDYQLGIARQISSLFEERFKITDPDTDIKRIPTPGDVGILCNTNKNCQELAEKLKQLNIPTAVENHGLMNTAEIRCIMAALKRLLFRGDSLSTAEILFLLDPNLSQSELLNNRLKHLNAGQSDWGSDSLVLSKLDDIQPLLLESSPSIIISQVISVIDAYYVSSRWGNQQQRIANIQKLLAYASEYEERGKTLKESASIPGFIIYMENLQKEEKDYKGILPESDAVQVLTYHKAKGLEWPIVIMLDLDRKEKNYEGLFSVKMHVDEENYNIEKPLDKRIIRYWPWPYGFNYGRLTGGDEYKKLFDNSAIRQLEFDKYLEEEKRLMYVGITRARDYLIVPYKDPKQLWFGRVFGDDIKAKLFTPENVSSENYTGTSWNGTPINYVHQTILIEKENEEKWKSSDKSIFLSPYAESTSNKREAKYIGPSSIAPLDTGEIQIKGREIHGRIPLTGSFEMDIIGNCIHNILAVIDWENDQQWEEIMNRVVTNFDLENSIDITILKGYAMKFVEFIKSNFNLINIYRELPLRVSQEGKVYSGFIDLLLEVADGYILIDYKTFPGGHDKLEEWTMKYTGQLSKYKEMVEQATGKRVLETIVYYPVNGSCVTVNFN